GDRAHASPSRVCKGVENSAHDPASWDRGQEGGEGHDSDRWIVWRGRRANPAYLAEPFPCNWESIPYREGLCWTRTARLAASAPDGSFGGHRSGRRRGPGSDSRLD